MVSYKKHYFHIAFAMLLLLGGYFFTAAVFPKNAGRYPFFVFLFLIDVYVWGLFRKKLFSHNNILKFVLVVVYWFPLFALVASSIVTLALRQYDWLPWLRNLVVGTIFTFYVAKFFMAVILFFADIAKWLKGIWHWLNTSRHKQVARGERKYKRSEFLQHMALVTGGLIVMTMFTGMFKWVHKFDVKRLKIRLKGLDDAFAGFSLVQISDLHLGSWSDVDALEEAVDDILSMRPDVIVFTGDLVNYTSSEADRFFTTLSRLKAPYGVYAILGNHDYGDYVGWSSPEAKQENMQKLIDYYAGMGWTLLLNQSVVISRGEAKLALIGVENWSANARFPRKGNLVQALEGVQEIPAKILLSHDPSHWSAQIADIHTDIGLTLSGHTHGFQFGIEIPGFKWSPAQYIYKHWAGLYESASGQYLYVNRGLGSIGYPGRIGILPEITFVELQTSKDIL